MNLGVEVFGAALEPRVPVGRSRERRQRLRGAPQTPGAGNEGRDARSVGRLRGALGEILAEGVVEAVCGGGRGLCGAGGRSRLCSADEPACGGDDVVRIARIRESQVLA